MFVLVSSNVQVFYICFKDIFLADLSMIVHGCLTFCLELLCASVLCLFYGSLFLCESVLSASMRVLRVLVRL